MPLWAVRGFIWTYAFHDLGEHELGLVDRGVEVVACFAGHGADLNRGLTAAQGQTLAAFRPSPGNPTNPISLEASVKRGSAERRDPWLQVSQAKVEREASMFAEDDDERLLGRAQHG
jgi:hypothetical protein